MLTALGAGLPLALTLGLGLAVAVGPHATTTPTAAMDCRKRRRLIRTSRPISRPPPARSAADYKRLLRLVRARLNTAYDSPVHRERHRERRLVRDNQIVSVATRCRGTCGNQHQGEQRPRAAPHPYFVQSAMLYISESHGDGSTPLSDFAIPDVTALRWIRGMTATSWIKRSFAWIASCVRLVVSASTRSCAISASKSLFE